MKQISNVNVWKEMKAKGNSLLDRLVDRFRIPVETPEKTLTSIARLRAWWEQRGWPLSRLEMAGKFLVFMSFHLFTYLFYIWGSFLEEPEHRVSLDYRWLAAWLLFTGLAYIGFPYKKIRPKQLESGRDKPHRRKLA